MSAEVLIMAGGTGGHVYPALAVARALQARSCSVVWLGTRSGLEARVVPAAGIPIEWLQVSGLRGHGAGAWLLAPWRVAHAIWQAVGAIRRSRAGVVLGMGGYVAGPGGVAAWLLRRPLIVHEQNAVAGLTNRLLAPLAREVFEAFPGSFAPRRRARHVGNPVRADIAALPSPAARFAGRSGPPRLLVLGGSQGALALNEVVPLALAAMDPKQRPQVWHQCGAGTRAVAEAAYANSGIDVRLVDFIEDMAGAYAWADLAVCRSGALTVAELAAAGLGAVLVPYPLSIDDHQTRNAEWLAGSGGALVAPQASLDPQSLAATLAGLLDNREELNRMATAARALARPDATEQVVAGCLQALGSTRGAA